MYVSTVEAKHGEQIMFTITGWRPGGKYHKVSPTLADALGCLDEAQKQGFLSIKVKDETGRIYLMPEMRRASTAAQSPKQERA